jgi:hypothetical protein
MSNKLNHLYIYVEKVTGTLPKVVNFLPHLQPAFGNIRKQHILCFDSSFRFILLTEGLNRPLSSH